jgi:hypothetical protein
MVAMKERTQLITVVSGESVSSAFNIRADEVFVGVIFPAMVDGNITLDYSMDGGTTYIPILDPIDGEDLLVVASGSDPGVIDISDFVRFAHSNNEHQMRFACASQSGEVTITVLTRG